MFKDRFQNLSNFGVALKENRLMEWTPPPKDGIDVPR